MKISLAWLSRYVDVSGLSPQEIATALTNAGLEVEDLVESGAGFSGVLVGKVLACEKHPNADKLRLVTVDLGNTQHTVVCGAPNVREGLTIAYATVGAKVYNRKDGSLFQLTEATIRGVDSKGMICSLEELNLQHQYEKGEDGIWVLNDVLTKPQLGQDLKEALGLSADTVLETAPTANRGDWMSYTGVAREVAALFDRPLTLPQVDIGSAKPSTLSVSLNDPSVCGYYGGLVVENITIGPSPDWLVKCLEAAGVRSISNVVDITNFVMLECGQPLHAFDLDTLKGKTIGVRFAKSTGNSPETLTTLDDINRSLPPEAVVVTLDDAPIALAGLMGGLDTEISDGTTRLFLEGAFFPSVTNRRSARGVGLRTEASARFERGVDPALAPHALWRAAALLQALAGGIVTGFVSAGTLPAETENAIPLSLRLSRFAQVIGQAIAKDKAVAILEKLGFSLQSVQSEQSASNDVLSVVVPSFRAADVTREIDLIEELVRIIGYDQVPYTLPANTVSVPFSIRQHWLSFIRNVLNGEGFQEVATNSLIGSNLLQKTQMSVNSETLVAVTQSHSEDHTMLRQSLLPNLLETLLYNQNQGSDSCWVYELGRVYFKNQPVTHKEPGVEESLRLSLLLSGEITNGNWQKTPAEEAVEPYFKLKGAVERLFSLLPLKASPWFEPAASPGELFHPLRTATLTLGAAKGPVIGTLGQLHPALQQKLKLKHPVILAELDIDALLSASGMDKATPVAKAISAYPFVERDMAFVVPDTITHQQVLQAFKQAKEPLLQEIQLFDEYRGKPLADDQRSLAYRLVLQSDVGTLTDKEIETAIEGLRKALQSKLSVQFR